MKYIKKIPQENIEVTEDLLQNGWKVLKEPSSLGVTIASAMPISIILMVLTIFFFMIVFPVKMNILDENGLSIEFTINLKSLFYVIGILIYTFFHEMIHALTIPNAIHSKKHIGELMVALGLYIQKKRLKKRDLF